MAPQGGYAMALRLSLKKKKKKKRRGVIQKPLDGVCERKGQAGLRRQLPKEDKIAAGRRPFGDNPPGPKITYRALVLFFSVLSLFYRRINLIRYRNVITGSSFFFFFSLFTLIP